ncbi:RNA polymerase sigma-70 factor [Dictyobacter aurantiacus]|uniref:DNA-directed RNA polymerase sigma-70 factor n=1 Tax=Dictyobacter aurantiacus TaxID=1936993 RepID=A0A401ZJU3_9CHLR|nr:RNA polymerase sigma-70 factor [Dictyobacter aurantiacus]GCE07121.1 DNA-directed RNA polymerase sigma-70 factor [Dictyobacter aurantiacus]
MDNTSDAQQEEIFQQYRSLLFSIAYRMLGSVMDAEDCVQEAFLRWYTRESEEEVENPKAYLCTLVTRRCIDRLRSAQAQRETYTGLWLPEPLIETTTTDPSTLSELGESLSMAFLLLLERLSPLERAVFLLRQVFDYDYAGIAEIVGKSEENCRQVMHRARRHLPTNGRLTQAPSYEQQQRVFTQFLQAYLNGDMDGLLHTLSDEIVLHADGGGKVRAALKPLYGAERVARYLLGLQQKVWQHVKATIQPAQINGQPGLVAYLRERWDEGQLPALLDQEPWYQQAADKGLAVLAMVFTCGDNQVREIDIIVNPEKLRHIPPLTTGVGNHNL